jgi:6-pyruvoyltetrahydropterin/6-carboxytetrahydropterin synthase
MKNSHTITRAIEIDIGHRVMHERVKCFSIHGHRIKINLTFSFNTMQAIGYCIDFKELKRIGAQWIDDHMDHGFVANPHDTVMIDACKKTGSKLYLMSLNGEDQYCNPTAENIATEILLAMEILFADFQDLQITQVSYHETPNCRVDIYQNSISETERTLFYQYRQQAILTYAEKKGKIEYDSRNIK